MKRLARQESEKATECHLQRDPDYYLLVSHCGGDVGADGFADGVGGKTG